MDSWLTPGNPLASAIHHDISGNLVFDGQFYYQYDAWNRLIQINKASLSSGGIEPESLSPSPCPAQEYAIGPMVKLFTYDGVGRLIRVQSPFPTPEASTGAVRSERFYYDGARRIQEIVTDPLATIGLAEDPEGEANNPGLGEQLNNSVPEGQQQSGDPEGTPLSFEQSQMQQPRGGEQQRPYGPDMPVAMIWPKGGQTDTGLDPYGRVRSTRSTEYCAGMNCCTSPPCDGEEPYRTHLRDDEGGPRPQDQCACVYHEDQKHPTEYRKPTLYCAGMNNSAIGAWYEGASLVPLEERKEKWTYDTRRNWLTHTLLTIPANATDGILGQPGDYQRSMTYSASDQPTQETIATFEDPTPRQYNIFHDKRGNLLDDGRQVFEYDALNRLTGVWESVGGGQEESEFDPGTKGDPVAAFTYDGYGHRLTARYNANDNGVIDDDPVDVYAYDRLWRVRTVTRATPSGSSAEATWTWYVREKWYYHDTESGQEMMTGPASTDAPIMRLIDRDGNGSFADPGEEQHVVNDHQGSTVLVTGKATLDSEGELVSRGPIIAHVKYDQYGVPKFVHPADVNSDGVVDAADDTFWKQAWNEYVNGASNQTPPKDIWKGVADANENGSVDISADPNNANLPSATNSDWLAFHALHVAGMTAEPLDQQLGNLPLYAGYWWDDAIGLYHVRHRVYRPEWGRWLQRDPLGYAPGWNLYQYVNGMPWGAVDPFGLEADTYRIIRDENGHPAVEHTYTYKKADIGKAIVESLLSPLALLGYDVDLGREEVTKTKVYYYDQSLPNGSDVKEYIRKTTTGESMQGTSDAVETAGEARRKFVTEGLQQVKEAAENFIGDTVSGATAGGLFIVVGTVRRGADVDGPGGGGGFRSAGGCDAPKTARDTIPAEWGQPRPTRKGDGIRWQDPQNPSGSVIRIDKGNPNNTSNPSQQVDHVVIIKDGKVIGRDGKPIKGAIADDPLNSHIPYNEWSKWPVWYSPTGQ